MRKIVSIILIGLLMGCQSTPAAVESSEFDCEANKYSLQLLDEGIFDYCAGGVLNQPEDYDSQIGRTWHFQSEDYQLWTIHNSSIAIFYQSEDRFVAKMGTIEAKDGVLSITTLDENKKEVTTVYQYEIVQGDVVGENEDGDVYATHLYLTDEEGNSLQATQAISNPFDPISE